jgi:heptosyltransferase-2
VVRRLLVRGPNWIGDAVMCEPALRGLKRLFPAATLSLLVKPAVAELFRHHPAVDHVLVYEDRGRHRGLSGKWALAAQLRRTGFELAVLFQNAFEAALLAYVGGIPRRFGYATDGRSLLLSEPVAVPDRRAAVHQVQYYWRLLKPLGLTGDPDSPRLFLSPDEVSQMTARLARSGIAESDTVIGINPGSTYGGAKRWLPDRFAEVADRLAKRLQETGGCRVAVVILGAKGEEQLGRDIAAQLSVPSAVLSGTTTIRELMAAVRRCRLLVTNDTGPMHIASAVDVPVVAIFGPTDWRTTSPYGMEHALVRQPVDCAPCLLRECPIDHRCMTGVSADMVYDAAIKGVKGLGIGGQGDMCAEQAARAAELVPPAGRPPLDGFTVFLDRDGTLNHDPGYVRSVAELKLLPGVPSALAKLKAAGARLVLVTNQSGVARGFLTLKDLEAIHARLQGLLEEQDAALDAVYFCPHHPDDGCRCRKPGRGMVDRAVADLQLDLRRSYLVGDHMRDIQLAKSIGARAVLVTPGPVDTRAVEVLRTEGAMPDSIVTSLGEAADWILKDAGSRTR